MSADAIATLSCTATWPGPDTILRVYTIHVETSSPTASGTPTRPPDSNGWYNHAVQVAFRGSSFSGIASCTTATYAGPASGSATVGGACRDNAGKVAFATSSPFAYDASPPAVHVNVEPADHVVRLSWWSSDVDSLASVEILRRPGVHGRPSSMVYRGSGSALRDRRVRDGARYRYTLIARDQAGNVSISNVAVTPGPRLLAPAPGALVAGPPLLLWTPVRGADYYNVQLYRGSRKVLSTWPGRPAFRLQQSWLYAGRRHRLSPGTYRWYVWPGFGQRATGRYGHRIGTRTFVVIGT